MRSKTLRLIGMSLFIASVSLSGCSNGSGSINENTFVITNEVDSINVSGSSVKKVEPDVAKITFTITSEAITPEESQSKNTEDTNAVISTLKELGVPDNKIKTYNYQMYPRYDYTYDSMTGRNGERILIGYIVNNTLEVSGLDVGKVGGILTSCVQAGINDIDGIDYTYSKYDEAYNEVLSDAINVAKTKAEAIANTSGVKVGSVKKVEESYQDTSYRYTNSVAMNKIAYANSEDGGGSFDAMPGEIEITAKVEVTFEIEK